MNKGIISKAALWRKESLAFLFPLLNIMVVSARGPVRCGPCRHHSCIVLKIRFLVAALRNNLVADWEDCESGVHHIDVILKTGKSHFKLKSPAVLFGWYFYMSNIC